MLRLKWQQGKSVCVGLDSEFEKIPVEIRTKYGSDVMAAILAFNKQIVDATHDIVCAYKPNSAFYEACGSDGINALTQTVKYIRQVAPDVPIILDAKRADIGNTNGGYVKFAFEIVQADAITVHPYLGGEALEPFLSQKEKGVIVLCRTSNPKAGEFQDLPVNELPLYQYVAKQVAWKWNKNGNCALVVGATYPHELRQVRKIVGEMPILIPGIGAQGGDVEATVAAGKSPNGAGMIISSSRGIIYATELQGEEFPAAARRETKKLHDQIQKYCG